MKTNTLKVIITIQILLLCINISCSNKDKNNREVNISNIENEIQSDKIKADSTYIGKWVDENGSIFEIEDESKAVYLLVEKNSDNEPRLFTGTYYFLGDKERIIFEGESNGYKGSTFFVYDSKKKILLSEENTEFSKAPTTHFDSNGVVWDEEENDLFAEANDPAFWDNLGEEIDKSNKKIDNQNIAWLWGVWEGMVDNQSFYIVFPKETDNIYRENIRNSERTKIYYNYYRHDLEKEFFYEGIYWIEDNTLALYNPECYLRLNIDLSNKELSYSYLSKQNSSNKITHLTKIDSNPLSRNDIIRKSREPKDYRTEDEKIAENERIKHIKSNRKDNEISISRNNSPKTFNHEADVRAWLNRRKFSSKDLQFVYMISDNTVYLNNAPIGPLYVKEIIDRKNQIVSLMVYTPYRTNPINYLLIGTDTLKDHEGRIYKYKE